MQGDEFTGSGHIGCPIETCDDHTVRGHAATLGHMADEKYLPLPDDADRVLVVVAHQDDMEYGGSGAVARWTAQGKQVGYLLVTRGEAGIDTLAPDDCARVRAHEQYLAALPGPTADPDTFLRRAAAEAAARLPGASAATVFEWLNP